MVTGKRRLNRANQSINQSRSKSLNQSINWSTNGQSLDQSINQSINQRIQRNSRTKKWLINQSASIHMNIFPDFFRLFESRWIWFIFMFWTQHFTKTKQTRDPWTREYEWATCRVNHIPPAGILFRHYPTSRYNDTQHLVYAGHIKWRLSLAVIMLI